MAEAVEIVLFIRVKPELIETARPHVALLVTETRKEAGVLRFDLFQDIKEAGTFILVQKWANQAALDAHRQTAHFAATIEASKEWLSAPIESRHLKPVDIQ
jgi:quinol monooxygenase YgiN